MGKEREEIPCFSIGGGHMHFAELLRSRNPKGSSNPSPSCAARLQRRLGMEKGKERQVCADKVVCPSTPEEKTSVPTLQN